MLETKFGKFITTKFFSILFLIIFILATFYMGLRIGNAAEWIFGVRIYAPLAVCLMLMLFMLLYSQNDKHMSRLDIKLKKISAHFICFLLYYVLIQIVFDIVGMILGLKFTVRAVFVPITAILSVDLIIYGKMHAKLLKTVKYSVSLNYDIPKTRLVLLSDLHIGVFVGEKELQKIADRVNSLKPDMVVISGDIFDGCLPRSDNDLLRIVAVFQSFNAPNGVYAVVGNHDPSVTNARFIRFLNAANIRLIYNEVVDTSEFNIVGRVGIVDKSMPGTKTDRVPLKDIMKSVNPKKPTIVLDHDPQGIREATACNADLVLCGHTHKGQFIPMTFLTRLANGRDYFYGYKLFGKTHSIISAGTGFFRLPIRIGTDSEIVVVDICRKDM